MKASHAIVNTEKDTYITTERIWVGVVSVEDYLSAIGWMGSKMFFVSSWLTFVAVITSRFVVIGFIVIGFVVIGFVVILRFCMLLLR